MDIGQRPLELEIFLNLVEIQKHRKCFYAGGDLNGSLALAERRRAAQLVIDHNRKNNFRNAF